MSNPTDPTPDGLPPVPPPPPPVDDDALLALSDLDEVAEAIPEAEPAGAAGFDLPDLPDVPAGERTMGVEFADLPEPGDTGLPPFPAATPADSWVAAAGPGSAVRLDPPARPAGGSSSSLFDPTPPTPTVEPASGWASGGSSLFGEAVPAAEPASGVSDVPLAAVAPDSAVGIGETPPVNPVSPASGWFPKDDSGVSDGIEAELAGPLPATGHGDGSDIFASARPTAPPADQSDVIAATSWADPDPVPPPAARSGGRSSDVALTFDQPPGGSTIQEPVSDLPVADEVPEAEALFGDSATLAHAPPLPGADAPDFGAAGSAGDDASSILADLAEPAMPLTDGSAVRLEAPGVDPTLGDPLPDDIVADATTTDGEPAYPPSLWQDEPTEEAELGGVNDESSVFALEKPAGSHFELTPDAPGGADPFAELEDVEVTPFGRPAGPSPSASEGDAVEFSDHPDPAAAAGAVDFGLPGDPATYPDRTIRVPVPEDDALDLTDPDQAPLPHPSTGDVLAAAGKDDAALDWMTGPDSTDGLGTPVAPSGGSGALSRSKMPRPESVDLSDPTDPGLADDAGVPPVPARPAPLRPKETFASSGSVELDWVAGSSTSELLLPEPPPPPPARPGRRTPAPVVVDEDDDDTGETRAAVPVGGGRVSRGAGVGLLFGLLLGGGIASGVYFSGVLDKGGTKGPVAAGPGTTGQTNPGVTTTPAAAAPPVTVADARAALDAGDPARALKALEAAGADTPEAKAARGQARLLARLREGAAPAADDAALKDARADLEAVVNDAEAAKTADGEKAAVRAAVHLGLTHELAGDRAKAKEVYSAAAARFPKSADVFQSAIDRLDATAPPAAPGGATSLRLAPADAERLAVAAAFLFVQDEVAPAAAEPAEAGGLFWRAVNLAAGGKYADAAATIDRAKAAHQARARALAGRGLNPLTDPLEQIFPRTCDDLKAYWQLRRTLYEHPGMGAIVRAEGPGKALDAAAAYRTERDTARADARLATEKLATAQKGLLAEQEALKTEKAALTTEKATTAKLTDDLKKVKADAVALGKDAEAAKKMADEFATKAKALDAELMTAEKGRKDAEATLAGVAGELRAGKLLPEKHNPADLVAAAKSAVSRATGPDLTSLIPPGVAATIGGPATTGTLLDLAARAGKSEAAAKQASAELAAANAKYKTDFARTKADYDAAVKAAADAHATALKKATEAADQALTKTKADAATELAKAKADATAAATKLKTDYDATVTKLKADHKVQLAAAEKKADDDAAAARAALAAAEQRFRAELADAVRPAEALPLWQPMLTELRRPADADPALAAADRVLKSAAPDSDDAARAHTIAGLALALKGVKDAARDRFEAAKRSPAYAPTKDWARAADVGLASLTDPAAASRVAVDTTRRRDPAEAARSLGAGIAAYNAGRYAAAERALADAAWHDPDGPLPWYFLGASRWAAGNFDQARDDFRQGAVREAKGSVPARVIGAAIAPIQGPARAALDAARP